MSYATQSTQVFDYGAYVQWQLRNLRRAKKLPEDKLENLAREAIRRLASKDQQLETVPEHSPSEEELEHLCEALISRDETSAAKIILKANANHVSPDVFYLKYLAAAARLLGDWWDQDRVGFWQVTVGTGRLLAVMRSMAHLFEPLERLDHRAAIFASVPGEQHIVGLHMAADLFRRDGWEIAVKVGLDHDQLIAEIESTPTHIVGLSMAGEHSLDALSKLVLALRICRPSTPILLSGHGVKGIRSKLAWMELDGVADNFDDAKAQMSALWKSQNRDAPAQ